MTSGRKPKIAKAAHLGSLLLSLALTGCVNIASMENFRWAGFEPKTLA